MRSGVDRAGMDKSVRPQDDLYLSTNGSWVKNTEIPADKSAWGAFYQLRDTTDHEVRGLVEALGATHPAAGTNGQKVDDFYRAYVDEAAIDKAGLGPVMASLKDVDSIQDAGPPGRPDGPLAGRRAHAAEASIRTPTSTTPRPTSPIFARAAWACRPRLLPEGRRALREGARGLCRLPDETVHAVRRRRRRRARRRGARAGDEDRDAAVAARQDARPEARAQPEDAAELEALAPGFDWPTFEAQSQLQPGKIIVVRQPDYVTALAGLIKSEPLETWKLYMKAARLDEAATVLPAAFRDASYQFHDVAIAGVKEQQPRWQLGVARTNGALGEAVGQLYVGRYFPPAYRARMQALVANLLQTYSTSIDGLTWMSPATKKEAHLKLSKYGVKIGYPDVWRDYSALEVRPGDALGNADRADAFEYRRQIVRTGGPVDRNEWGMTPQTINAYYSGNKNEIVFPAAILQPPFFNVAADDAVNYGAIGAVIGHEISHGFDDKGSQLDGDGRLRNWWTDDDRKAFDEVTSRLVAQYEAYSPIPGQHLNAS